jgi:hypothetical protein
MSDTDLRQRARSKIKAARALPGGHFTSTSGDNAIASIHIALTVLAMMH